MILPQKGAAESCPSGDIGACIGDRAGGIIELTQRGVGSPSNSLVFRDDNAVVTAFTHPNTVATHTLRLESGYGILTQTHAIVGSSTGLDEPNGMAFDTGGNMYVVNTGLSSNAGTVTVYPPDADGNVAPIRTITGLEHPFALTIGP